MIPRVGLLSWLFGRRSRLLDDRIYATCGDRDRGFVDAVATRSGAGEPVLIVAHDPENLVRACTALREAGIAFEARSSYRADGATQALTVAALPDPGPAHEAGPAWAVHAVDIHRDSRENDRLLHIVDAMPAGASLRHFLALDDPLLRHFAGPQVTGLLERLGLKDGEAIESSMVTRSVRRALKKLEATEAAAPNQPA